MNLAYGRPYGSVSYPHLSLTRPTALPQREESEPSTDCYGQLVRATSAYKADKERTLRQARQLTRLLDKNGYSTGQIWLVRA
jgi:hypothetical protein